MPKHLSIFVRKNCLALSPYTAVWWIFKKSEPFAGFFRLMGEKKQRCYFQRKGKKPLDRSTFATEVLAAENTLYHIAKSMLINDSDCEDVVQNAVLRAYERLDTLREQSYFRTWLIRILINECNSYKRRGHATISYEDYAEAEQPNYNTDYSVLYQAICALKPKIRVTIVLHYLEGYSVDEIKAILKIPSGTVKSRLSTGRELLKSKLEQMGGL